MQYGTSRSRLVRVPPLRWRDDTEIVERDVGELWAAGGLANRQTSGALVSSRSFDRDYPRSSKHDTATSSPIPVGVGCASGRDQEIAAVDGLIACRRAHLETTVCPDRPCTRRTLTPRCTVMPSSRSISRTAAVTSESSARRAAVLPPRCLRGCRSVDSLCQLQADISATKQIKWSAVDRARAPRYW